MAEQPALVAERIVAALAARVWSFGGTAAPGACQVFLLLRGHAVLTCLHQPEVEICGPAMLWLPQPLRGALLIKAGGDGYSATVSAKFMQRIVNDPMLAGHQQPFTGRAMVIRADQVAARSSLLTASFEALVQEARVLEPGAAAAMGLHLGVLVLHLWRSAGLRDAAGHRGETTVQRFMRLVELHYREGMPVSVYARRLGVSPGHLHEACARVAARTPLALIHDRLLEEARARLQQTELSVGQIGYSLGFRDPGYFNRFFKRLAGQSPGAFRKAAGPRRSIASQSFAAWP